MYEPSEDSPTTQIVVQPDEVLLSRHFRFSGQRCHCAPAFLRAFEPAARLVWFGQEQGGELQASAVASLRRGRWVRRLVCPAQPIVTAGAVSGEAPFWSAIRQYCRQRRVARIAVQSFEGQERFVPPLGTPRVAERTEYEVDLRPPPELLLKTFSENHRRNIKKADRHGLVARIETAPAAAEEHARLFRDSMQRRAARGETVPAGDAARVRRLLQAGCGRLFRAEQDGRPVASLCILTSAERAYYDSGGSAREGMQVGASHRAMWHAMQQCRAEGIRWFRLGGVSERDSPGLAAFKEGFAPRAVPLAHSTFAVDLPFPWSLAPWLLAR